MVPSCIHSYKGTNVYKNVVLLKSYKEYIIYIAMCMLPLDGILKLKLMTFGTCTVY